MYLCKAYWWQYFCLCFLRTDISDPLEGTDWSVEGLQLLLRSQQYGLEPASLLDVSVGGGRGERLCGTQRAVNQIDHALHLLV